LFGLVQWPEQGRLRRLGQRLARCEGRALVRVPEQHREQALVRFDKRRPEQGRDIRLKQGLLRLQLRVLLQRRQRPPEQGLFRGKAFPLPPRGRNEREEGMRE
jgi:hypothetical protein